jgi:hypothetical protein
MSELMTKNAEMLASDVIGSVKQIGGYIYDSLSTTSSKPDEDGYTRTSYYQRIESIILTYKPALSQKEWTFVFQNNDIYWTRLQERYFKRTEAKERIIGDVRDNTLYCELRALWTVLDENIKKYQQHARDDELRWQAGCVIVLFFAIVMVKWNFA